MARKKKLDSALITSILYLVVGIVLAAFPGEALKWAIYIIGGVFVLSGILELVKKNYFGGALSLIIGLVVIFLGGSLLSIILLVLGILIAVKGVIDLVNALKRKRKKLMQVLFPILTVAVGIFLAFGNAHTVLIIIGGILLAVNGIIGLASSLRR